MPRVVILMQENKTTDYYFPTLAAWGAEVQNSGNLLAAPPIPDPPHDRNAWLHYKMGDYPAAAVQIDNDRVLPYYSWLAKQFTFCDHHFGLGTNSTPGHMLAVGGQTPTLRNPPAGTSPVWDLPTIFKHVERAGISWGAFTGADRYPVLFYAELGDAAGRARVYTSRDPTSDTFTRMARSGALPQFCFVWSPSGYDEHPPDRTPDPAYVTKGHDLTWQRVDAVVQAGGWQDTVFILTWDDWGGYADHVATPDAETAVDPQHPNGFQVIGGSRIPLLMFGGRIKQGIESTWHSHACIPKTVIDVFQLPPFGVPRVDTARSLADRVDPALARPQPPGFGGTIAQPPAPTPKPRPVPPAPWEGPNAQPMPKLVANGGKSIPAPSDAVVRTKPPSLPAGLSGGGTAGTRAPRAKPRRTRTAKAARRR
ncbi:MAG TPA: alkaline phosphatase family protein [bacterium]|nr:alkaline phosphatase family protein [bacterium]